MGKRPHAASVAASDRGEEEEEENSKKKGQQQSKETAQGSEKRSRTNAGKRAKGPDDDDDEDGDGDGDPVKVRATARAARATATEEEEKHTGAFEVEGEEAEEETWPYEVDDGDHFETPREAFEDIATVLRGFGKLRGKSDGISGDAAAAELQVYDPYFCTGRTAFLLGELGFPKVINRRRDFYADIENRKIPKFDVLVTNPPYSGDHKKRLFDWLLDVQEEAIRKKTPKPFCLLLPSWTVGKAVFQKFLKGLATLQGVDTSEDDETPLDMQLGIFYLCRRSRRGNPLKYTFDHVRGIGKADCPFFGLWICGGFGDAAATRKVMKNAAKTEALGRFPDDQGWYECHPGLPLVRPADDSNVTVKWADGTCSDIPPSSIVGGLLVFPGSRALECSGLLRSAEDVRRRQNENPKQKLRRERAMAALERQRAIQRDALGADAKKKRKRRRSPTGQARCEDAAEAAAAAASLKAAASISSSFGAGANTPATASSRAAKANLASETGTSATSSSATSKPGDQPPGAHFEKEKYAVNTSFYLPKAAREETDAAS
eukprot:CAMPEP_0206438100 /NCGR_PEP_ID=MMETSP0324_2-20121206/11418_1 /ASSEMBLY_ACC=CAM_ASM_000836 /TAXON_ID=2866 /ORGANISM="Crypthecodinium cohnii, Strain Seligo" /LENGTH=546 /DNA_ID=CAMNT_0053905473 /DNA_START=40 /DNA_END=1678 /DNA_ORIENTATION=+